MFRKKVFSSWIQSCLMNFDVFDVDLFWIFQNFLIVHASLYKLRCHVSRIQNHRPTLRGAAQRPWAVKPRGVLCFGVRGSHIQLQRGQESDARRCHMVGKTSSFAKFATRRIEMNLERLRPPFLKREGEGWWRYRSIDGLSGVKSVPEGHANYKLAANCDFCT